MRLKGSRRPRGPGSPPRRSLDRDAHGSRRKLWIRSSQRFFVRRKGDTRFVSSDRGLPFFDGEGASFLEDDGRSSFLPSRAAIGRGIAADPGRDSGLERRDVTCVFRDREGSVWIGFGGSGLARWVGYREWKGGRVLKGLRNDRVRSVVQDGSGAFGGYE